MRRPETTPGSIERNHANDSRKPYQPMLRVVKQGKFFHNECLQRATIHGTIPFNESVFDDSLWRMDRELNTATYCWII